MLGRAVGYFIASSVVFVAWLGWLRAGDRISTRWAAWGVRMFPTSGSDRIQYNEDARLRAAITMRRTLLLGLPIFVVIFASAGITYLLQ
jgi:hypothetical protein